MMNEDTDALLKADDSYSGSISKIESSTDDIFQSALGELSLKNSDDRSDDHGDDTIVSNCSSLSNLEGLPQLPVHNIPLNKEDDMTEGSDQAEVCSNRTNETLLNYSPDTPMIPSPPMSVDINAKSKEIYKIEPKDQYIHISVTEASKIGDGMSSYVTYKIEIETNIELFRRRSFSVHRRFSDFLGLHEKLIEKYLRSGRIIPPAPEKDALGTTKVKISSSHPDQPTNSCTEFVERRRAALERYLRRTAAHPVLKLDPDFREFLEAEELPKATSTSALSGAGVKRLLNKVGITVNKMAFKMDENEPWFEEKAVMIENIHNQLRRLHAVSEELVVNRKELANHTCAFAKSIAVLGHCDEHTGLARALSQLADVEEKVEGVLHEQSTLDYSFLSELLKDYVYLLGGVKDVFHERVKVYQNWQHAQMMLNKKREAKARFELSAQTEKANITAKEVVEWEAKVDRCEEEFRKISNTIKAEYEIFEKNRIKEFKSVMIEYMEALIKQQEQIAKHWESFLPEARAV